MKRKFFFTIMAFIFVLFLGSCKKTDCPVPTYPTEGYWVGKYGSGTATPSNGFSMVVEPGGKVTIADGDNITSSAKATFTIQANWSNDGKMTSGTWGSGASPSGSGTWYMDRKN